MDQRAGQLAQLALTEFPGAYKILKIDNAPIFAFMVKAPGEMKAMFARLVLFSLPVPVGGKKLLTTQEIEQALQVFLGWSNWFHSAHQFVNGFEGRGDELAAFFNAYSDAELNDQEKELKAEALRLGLIKQAGPQYTGVETEAFMAVHTAIQTYGPFRGTIKEELAHSIFTADPEFARQIRLLWESLPATSRTAFVEHLKQRPMYQSVSDSPANVQGYEFLLAEFAGKLRDPHYSFYVTAAGRNNDFTKVRQRFYELESGIDLGPWISRSEVRLTSEIHQKPAVSAAVFLDAGELARMRPDEADERMDELLALLMNPGVDLYLDGTDRYPVESIQSRKFQKLLEEYPDRVHRGMFDWANLAKKQIAVQASFFKSHASAEKTVESMAKLKQKYPEIKTEVLPLEYTKPGALKAFLGIAESFKSADLIRQVSDFYATFGPNGRWRVGASYAAQIWRALQGGMAVQWSA